MRLRALAPGKLNLGLRLGPIRDDGRHELVTVFESVSLADELALEVLPAGSPDVVLCPGVPGENLAARALAELRARGWGGPPVRIEIAKRVPVAAGMGGGSGDAAATLRLAAALTPVDPAVLAEVAVTLGADVPAQLAPGLALGTGAGDQVEPLPHLGSHACVVLPDSDPLPTPAVFAAADRLGLPRPAEELDVFAERMREACSAGARPPDDLLANDLEPAARSLRPAVGDALARVRGAGAELALMCGSGPTVAGLFWGPGARAHADAAAARLGAGAAVAEPVPSGSGAPSPA